MKKKFVSMLLAGCICCSSSAVCVSPLFSTSAAKQITASVINISVAKNPIAIGESIQLQLEWSNGKKQALTFSSSDESIATVDENGLVTDVSDGTAVITLKQSETGRELTFEITVSEDVEKSVVYNASELKLGDKLRKYDTIHYDKKRSSANVVNKKGSYDVAFLTEKDYILPFDAEIVGIDADIVLYIAPDFDELTYIDGRTLKAGDMIDKRAHLLCYDYYIKNAEKSTRYTYPVFLPKYYEEIIGEGNIKVSDVDNANKTIILEAVPALKGDINGDGKFTIADAVLFQSWLLGINDSELANWKCADMNDDGILDVYDLCMLKDSLVKENKTEIKQITLDDVKELGKKGNELRVSDFAPYKWEGDSFEKLYFLADYENCYVKLRFYEESEKPVFADFWINGRQGMDIRSEDLNSFLELLRDPENSEETRKDADTLAKYAFEKFKDGKFSLETYVERENAAELMNDEAAEIFNKGNIIALEFIDEHTIMMQMFGGGIDIYGYVVTDGTVKYEPGSKVTVTKYGFADDAVNITDAYGDIYYFKASF